jgi:hypothetical protein
MRARPDTLALFVQRTRSPGGKDKAADKLNGDILADFRPQDRGNVGIAAIK